MYKKLTKDLGQLLRHLECKPGGALTAGAVATILDWTDSAKHPLHHVMQAVGIVDRHKKQADTLRMLKIQEKSFVHWAHIISRYNIKLFWVFMLQNSQTKGSDLLQKVSKRAMAYLKKLHTVLKKKSESEKTMQRASSENRNKKPCRPKKKTQEKSAQKKSHTKCKVKKNMSIAETATNRRKNLLVCVVATLLAGRSVHKCNKSVDRLIPEVIPGDQFKQVLAITVALVYSTANLKWALKSDFIPGEQDTTYYDPLHPSDDYMYDDRDRITKMYQLAREINLNENKNVFMNAAKELSIKPYKSLDWANSESDDTTLAAIRQSLAEYSPIKASDFPKKNLARPEDQLFYIAMVLISCNYSECSNPLSSGSVGELLLHLALHHLPAAEDDVNAKGEVIWDKFPAFVDVDQMSRLWCIVSDEQSIGDNHRCFKKKSGKQKSKKGCQLQEPYISMMKVSQCGEADKVAALDGSRNFFGEESYVKECFKGMRSPKQL